MATYLTYNSKYGPIICMFVTVHDIKIHIKVYLYILFVDLGKLSSINCKLSWMKIAYFAELDELSKLS